MTDQDKLLRRLNDLVIRVRLLDDYSDPNFKRQLTRLENDITEMIEIRNNELIQQALNPNMTAAA